MKIGFTIKSLEGRGGGAERVLASVASGLAQRGHDVTVLTFDRPGFDTFYPLAEDIRRIGLGLDANLASIAPKDFLAAARGMRKQFSGKCDVLVAFMHSAYVPAALALIDGKTPLVLSEHASPQFFQDRKMQRRLAALATRRAYAKTVVSDALLDDPPTQGGKTVAIENPLPEANSGGVRPFDPEARTILAAGIFRPEKGFDVLLRAFDRVAQRHPDWRLQIAGDGPLRTELETLLQTLPSRTQIELAGFQSDLSDWYAGASFVTVPSRNESQSLVTAEALTAARGVVAFADCVGPAEMLRSGHNGLLVDPGNDRVEALSQGLDTLMADPVLLGELAANARGSLSGASLDQVLDRWEILLNAAAAREPIPPALRRGS